MSEQVVSYADVQDFCERHKFNSTIRRCCHLGNRFVAEARIAGRTEGYIDYIEDQDDGDIRLECFGRGDRAVMDAAWEEAVAKMLRGEAPTPEASV